MKLEALRVRVVPLQPHGLAFGGFELQMINALKAAKFQGIEIQPLDFWNKNDSYEILHLWGLSGQHINSAYWAKKTGKKVFLSALTRYPSIWNNLRTNLSTRIGQEKSNLTLLSYVDGISVVNKEQKLFIANAYKYPLNRIFVIPNIVEKIFYEGPDKISNSKVSKLKDYVITTGNICKRKNQLKLAQACMNEGVPLLIVGPALPGEEKYIEQLSNMIAGNKNIEWISGMEPASDDLYVAYKNSIGFALPSNEETQPISALEAAVMGKPLLLGKGTYSKQKLYFGALLADCNSINDIQKKVSILKNNFSDYRIPQEYLEECTENSVGESYRKAYYEIAEL